MTITTFWSSTISQTVVQSGTTTPGAADLSTAPDQLDPDTFLTWDLADQVKYLETNTKDTSFPKTVVIGSGDAAVTFSVTDSPLPEIMMTGQGIIQPTSGDFQPIPYENLTGSAAGTPSAIVSASAEALFPTLDGTTHTLPVADQPADFDVDITDPSLTDDQKTQFLQDFSQWDSSYQLQYIKLHGTGGDATTGAGDVLDVTVGTGASAIEMTAVVSITDPTKFYIVQSLDKDAISKMSLQDQAAVVGAAGGAPFSALASSLGLSTLASAQVTALYAKDSSGNLESLSLTEYIEDMINQVKTQTGTNVSGTLPTDAQTPFITELTILENEVKNSVIVSPADIQQKVTDINTRFTRLFDFWDVAPPTTDAEQMGTPNSTIDVYNNVVSQDGDLSGIQHGYQVFLSQENTIADLATERSQIVADNGIFQGTQLDVPELVYKFQSLYSDQVDAEVTADTEEVNQQNALLKTYAAIQDIINQTLTAFQKSDDGAKVLYGATDNQTDTDNSVDYANKISSTDMYTLSMFEDLLGKGQLSPMEKILGITRPLMDFFKQDPGKDDNYDLNSYTQPQWSSYSTRLSEAVTLINQNSQIQMNDINSLSKEKDQHFDLANNALSKMADIIENIARID